MALQSCLPSDILLPPPGADVWFMAPQSSLSSEERSRCQSHGSPILPVISWSRHQSYGSPILPVICFHVVNATDIIIPAFSLLSFCLLVSVLPSICVQILIPIPPALLICPTIYLPFPDFDEHSCSCHYLLACFFPCPEFSQQSSFFSNAHMPCLLCLHHLMTPWPALTAI